MTKAEWRIRNFSSGMQKLGDNSRNYMHKLTHILFLVEHAPICPVLEHHLPVAGNQSISNRRSFA
ncbi:MAG: hypothetical protein FWD36_09110 [Treponema sp.]|nr:hypothetical protein [Treponema sp.]